MQERLGAQNPQQPYVVATEKAPCVEGTYGSAHGRPKEAVVLVWSNGGITCRNAERFFPC